MKKLIDKAQYIIHKLTYTQPNVIDRLETSEKLVENSNMSLVRYGDGELGQIINQQDIGFQKYDNCLAKRLYEILVSGQDKNILICIPNVFDNNINQMKDEPKKYWTQWIRVNRKKLKPLFSEKIIYGDSLVSRLYLPWIDKSKEYKIVENLKKTWKDKNVVIVEGEKTCWGVGNDLLDMTKSVKRIICPAENAFAKYEEILSTCLKHAHYADVFILALGPTATVLAYDLAKLGMRALDLGHFDLQYEYLIKQIDNRVKIKGKYNNELQDSNVETCVEEAYIKSIVCKINR